MQIQEKIIGVILAVVLCIVIGWHGNTIYTGYKNQGVLLQQEAVQETIRQGQAAIAKGFEDHMVVLRSQEAQNHNTVTTIIKNNQPIYSQVCIDQSGLDHLKELKDASNANRGL